MAKKTIKVIVENIFKELNEIPKTISDIANNVKSYHKTIKDYLELIEFIQSQPKLLLERTGHSYQAKIKKN
jgi:hypothetical protein